MNFLENRAITIAIDELNKAHEQVGKVIYQLMGACDEKIDTKKTIDLAIERCNSIQDNQLSELHSWMHALKENKTK